MSESSELTLFVDPYKIEYPSLVKEVLSQVSKDTNICAALTPQKYCLLLCSNVMYIWTFSNRARAVPHAFRLSLPASGLKYSVNSVSVFKRCDGLSNAVVITPSVLAVSPEGCLRYWPEAGKPHRDQNINLQNDVAFSIILIESLGHLDRFLLSTATCSFFIVEIFHSMSEQSERISVRALEMDSPDGIGRRMSKMLFGYATEKESITKTMFVKGQLKAKNVDILAILPKTLRFFSIESRSLLYEVNVAKIYSETIKVQLAENKPIDKEITILDCVVYRKGILILIGAIKHTKAELYLAYLEKKREPSNLFEVLVPILLPESMAVSDPSKLSKCQIFSPNCNECVVVLPKSLILVRHPTTENVHAAILENIDDILLGASCIDGLCHVILRESGVCALRRLPKAFDLSFWDRYRGGLEGIIDEPFSDNFFKEAYVVFCSKDLIDSRDLVLKLQKNSDINYSELAVELTKYFADRIPLDDPRWTNEGYFQKDQMKWLKEHSTTKNFALIMEQLDDKLCHYKMFVLFLQHFKLIDKLDRSIESMNGRTGLAVLAEYGEKLILMMLCAKWLSENLVPLISQSFKTLAAEFIRRFNHPENEYLTYFDHVFNEVSCFHEVVSAVVKSSEKELRESNLTSDTYERIINEVSAFLGVLAEGVTGIHEHNSIVKVPQGTPTWLNNSQFLIYFIRHLNAVLEFLAAKRDDNLDYSCSSSSILDQSLTLARFVLSQQTRWQRDNSSIIAKFYEIGKVEEALSLAEEFQDFTMLIEYCHKSLSDKECKEKLDEYKIKYNAEDFDLFLYEYYREKGMVNYLLAEKGNRVNEFLSAHESINWIKNIEKGEYLKARRTLKSMAFETKDPVKKLTELSLCKLCVLCEDNLDVAELADLSENIRELARFRE